MSESSGAGLRVALRPSLAVAAALAAVHAGALAGALALPGYPWSASIATFALILSAGRGIARHALRRGRGAVVAVVHSQSQGWRVTTATGDCVAPCTLAAAFVHPRISILSFTSARGRMDVLVPHGASDPDEARRLRILLRRLSAHVETHPESGLLLRALTFVQRGLERCRDVLRLRFGTRAGD